MALHLPINEECDSACVFCSAAGRPGDFRLESLLKRIDEDESGHVQVSGGDPLRRAPAELLQILVHCKKRGKIVELQTNAARVPGCDEKTLRLLARLADYFNVNFPAHTPELDYAITRLEGGFGRRLMGVRRLLSLGAKVRLSHVVCRPNFPHLPDFVDFLWRSKLPIAWVQFSFVKAVGRAQGSAEVVPRFQDAAPFLNRALARCREIGLAFEVDHIPVCFVPDFKEQHVDYRKMREKTPGVHLSEKQRTADCAACALKELCPGPRKDYLAIHRSLT